MSHGVVRVCLFGDVDLNVIDGSAVWLVSLAEALATQTDVEIHLLLKADIERELLTSGIAEHRNITVWPPGGARITPSTLPERLQALDRHVDFDVVIVRGLAAARAVADSGRFEGRLWLYLTDIPQRLVEMTGPRRAELDRLFARSARVLCQTENLRAFLSSVFPLHDAKYLLLPPMVPEEVFAVARASTDGRPFRMLYAGKFAPGWGVEHMVESFTELRTRYPRIEFHIAGDKIHDPPAQPGFKARITAALQQDGVVWHGALSRAAVFELLGEVDVALAMRDGFMDESRELSTKLLEYCAAGVPVFCNRNLIHEELFGSDSPLLLDGHEQLTDALNAAIRNPAGLRAIGDSVRSIALEHSFQQVGASLTPALHQARAVRAEGALTGRVVVVSGHDLKFARPLISCMRVAGATVIEDLWGGHGRHDAEFTRDALNRADTAIAEWCLGNAVHYATAVRPDQRFVVRFHRTELNSHWPTELDWRRADDIVFVGDHVRAEAIERFGWSEANSSVIANFVDEVALDRPKQAWSRFTLGLLGYLPSLKRLDRALDLLESLRRHDRRFRLVVKGAAPWELDWVWKNPTERDYFERQYDRVVTSLLLGEAVTFEPAGPNVAAWLSSVGVILSPSDIESFHLALVEGMLSRAVPIVWDRPGADAIVSPGWMADTESAATRILDWDEETWLELGRTARQEATDRYSFARTWRGWLDTLGPGPGLSDARVAEPPLPEIRPSMVTEVLARRTLVPYGMHITTSVSEGMRGGWEAGAVVARAWGIMSELRDVDASDPSSHLRAADLVSGLVQHGSALASLLDEHPDAEWAAALFVVATSLGGSAEDWTQRARSTLSTVATTAFSDAGMHLAGSPAVHVRVVAALEGVARFCSANGLTVPDGVDTTLDRAAEVARILTRSDGTLPAIGEARLASGWQAPATSEGADGDPISGLSQDLVDARAGIAILRTGNPTVHVAVRIGRSEHHADTLAVVVHAGGREWVTDPGPAPADVGHAARAAYTSTIGHSTVTRGEDPPTAQVELVDRFRTDREMGVIARSVAPGWSHTRSVRLELMGGRIRIIDIVWSSGRAEQRFQIPSDLEVSWDRPDLVTLTDGSGRVMTIHQGLPTDLRCEEVLASPGSGPRSLVYAAPRPGAYRWETVLEPHPADPENVRSTEPVAR